MLGRDAPTFVTLCPMVKPLFVAGLLVASSIGCVGEDPGPSLPPCGDARFYEPPVDMERPVGAATVYYVGSGVVELEVIDTGELAVFPLPVEPSLERDEELMIEAVEGGYLVSRDGEPVFLAVSDTGCWQLRRHTYFGVELEVERTCQAPPGEGLGMAVYSVVVADIVIAPGATTEVTLPDGREALVHNRLINSTMTGSVCGDFPHGSYLVDFIFQ